MMNIMLNRTLRYGGAVVFIIAAFFLRQALVSVFGAELPHWITFYPVIMCVALMAGLGPGVLATVTAVLLMDYFVFPPVGSIIINSSAYMLSLIVFSGMGLFMSVVAERYRRGRDRLEELVEERTGELSRTNEGLKAEVEERKRAEESLRESDERLRLAQSAAHIGIWDWHLGTGQLDWTPELEHIYGYAPGTFDGDYAGFRDRVHPDDLAEVESQRDVAVVAHQPFNFDFRVCLPPGETRWVNCKGAASYDTAGQPQRVFGVNVDITERKKAEEEIKESLREKEVLLSEIHHRVKNNLQVISSLVGLQADSSTDETVRSVLADVTDRVRSMALVHEKLYQSANFASIDFAEYAEDLLGYLWHAHSSEATAIRLTLDMEPVSLPVDKAVPCGLILNELAGNALKHAFRGRDKGEVTVSLFADADDRIHLRVKDDGVGLPEGFDWRQTQTLGLNLVQILSRQLRADVEVSGIDGTRFEITFS